MKSIKHLPKRLHGLNELASNLWWSWHPMARMLFKTLNRQAWKESGHNPVKMLTDVPKDILESASADSDYLKQYDLVLDRFRKERDEKGCVYLEDHCERNTFSVAYFCAEYGLHHSMPFYAGGLGFLASDFIKECSDLKIPIVAVGFMYPEGYFCQRIREDGWQENIDEILDRDSACIVRVIGNDGKQIKIKVPFIEPPIWFRIVDSRHPSSQLVSGILPVKARVRDARVFKLVGAPRARSVAITKTKHHSHQQPWHDIARDGLAIDPPSHAPVPVGSKPCIGSRGID